MAQRKKKQSGHQLEIIAKAHHKNEFLRKFKYICNSCCDGDIYSLIPQKVIDRIYQFRYHTFKVLPAEGHLVTNVVLSNIKSYLSRRVKMDKIVLSQTGIEITIEDYFTVALTVQGYSRVIEDKDFLHADLVRSALNNFEVKEGNIENALEKLFEIISALGYWESKIGGYMYWLKYDQKLIKSGGNGMNNILEVYSHKPETGRAKINGKVRPVIRLGWGIANTGVEWAKLQPSLLNIKNGSSDLPLKVYVQSHTLKRLDERIDCVSTTLSHLNFFSSIVNAKVFYDNNHHILIEHRICECKVGYFRVDIVDGIAVVRTFLFLTQSGTPEGQLLWKNTGLQKLDTKYLAMDKLSSFMSSDIGDNDRVRKILQNSGCQGLLDLYAIINKCSTKHPSHSLSSMMLDYLGITDHHFPEDLTDLTGCDNLSEPEKMSSEIAGIV